MGFAKRLTMCLPAIDLPMGYGFLAHVVGWLFVLQDSTCC